MTKRMKLTVAGIILSIGMMFSACSTGEVIQQTAQAGYTLSAATPSAGGINLAGGHR